MNPVQVKSPSLEVDYFCKNAVEKKNSPASAEVQNSYDWDREENGLWKQSQNLNSIWIWKNKLKILTQKKLLRLVILTTRTPVFFTLIPRGKNDWCKNWEGKKEILETMCKVWGAVPTQILDGKTLWSLYWEIQTSTKK